MYSLTLSGRDASMSCQVSLSCGPLPAVHSSQRRTSRPHAHRCTPMIARLMSATITMQAESSRSWSWLLASVTSMSMNSVDIRPYTARRRSVSSMRQAYGWKVICWEQQGRQRQ